MRVDQVEPEVAEEQLPAEAGLTPISLPCFFSGLACLTLTDLPD
jgi:hypothetical protein